MSQDTPYQRLGGEAGLRALTGAFYDAMDELPEAATIRAMHADDLTPMKEKLFEYLSGWLGGPRLYEERHGTVCLTEAHRPYAIGPAERDQWLRCMEVALDRVGADADLQALLREPFFRIADFMTDPDT